MDDNKQLILDALNFIDPADFSDYNDWLHIGMALHYEGFPMSIFDEWSRRDPNKYNARDLETTWNSFGKSGGRGVVTGATIIQFAKDRGFDTHRKMAIETYEWDDTLLPEDDLAIRKTHVLTPCEQLKTYLKAVFKDEDKVGYATTDCFFNEKKQKWQPLAGVSDRTAAQLIKELEKYPDDIECVVGTINKEAGAWIRINPLDGKGAMVENVTSFNYVLIESDEIPKPQQIAFYNRWKLPIVALVDSGSKSVHAIVHIDAPDLVEYDTRVRELFKFLGEHNFPADQSNKTANKFSRMPGVTRNGVMQTLLATHIGCQNYEEWKKYLEEEEKTFPVMNVTDFFHNPEPQKPELIHGVLRKGHVLMVTGPSKAGKSFLMGRLAVCLSEGKPFLKHECEKAKVVYINPEIEPSSIGHRFIAIYDALQIEEPSKENPIQVINLRGTMETIEGLISKLITKYKEQGVDVFIIDPIYKFMEQDESNAQYITFFLGRLEHLSHELNATIVFSHHHKKGSSADISVIDRGSGSGIFARQADAIMDLNELDMDEDFREENGFEDSWTAYEIEYVTREFKRPKSLKVIFKYPLHEIDESGILKELFPVGDIRNAQKKNKKQTTIEDRYNRFVEAFFAVSEDGKTANLGAVAARAKVAPKTIRNNIEEIGGYYIQESIIYRVIGVDPNYGKK